MRSQSGKLSAAQAVMMVVVAIVGSATLIVPGGMIKVAAQDAWLSAVLGTAVVFVSGSLWVWLGQLWPGRDVFQLVRAAGGRWLGGLISLLLLLWFFLNLTGATWIGSDTILTGFLPDTPRAVVAASILVPAACAARSRHEVVARLSQWCFWGVIGLLLFLVPVSAPEMRLERLTPVLGNGFGPVVSGAAVLIGFLSENMVLVTLLPLIRKPFRPWRLVLLTSVLAGGIILLLAAWTVSILGPRFPGRSQYPVLTVAHVISIGDILERLDALMMALWIAGEVAKIAFWYWLVCVGIARLLKLRDYRSLVWPIFLAVATATLVWADNSPDYPVALRAWTLLFTPLVSAGAPLVLLAITALRRWQRGGVQA